mmetsp:Transcript_14006/g.27312  ORF Transcript_14006/g.27312 Transcript_14006/m.27312 type:complete len:232 (+) Transcript_14006:129-824(+)
MLEPMTDGTTSTPFKFVHKTKNHCEKSTLFPMFSLLGKPLLDVCNRLPRVQMFRTNLSTIHDGMTTVKLKCIIQLRQSFVRKLITRILNPPVCLHQHSRSKVLIGIPPIGWASGTAACAKDTLVHSIKLCAILASLKEFSLALRLAVLSLKPGLNGAVLLVEISHIGNQILDNIHVRQRVNLGHISTRLLLPLRINVTKTGEGVASVDVHGARPANSLTARSAESQSGVLL